jgi:hypothetical protein
LAKARQEEKKASARKLVEKASAKKSLAEAATEPGKKAKSARADAITKDGRPTTQEDAPLNADGPEEMAPSDERAEAPVPEDEAAEATAEKRDTGQDESNGDDAIHEVSTAPPQDDGPEADLPQDTEDAEDAGPDDEAMDEKDAAPVKGNGAAEENPTLIDAPRSLVTAQSTELPAVPDEEEIRDLYEAFVAAQKDTGGEDVEFAAFAQTVEETAEQLLGDHACRAVRFRVTVENGEVALLPRLLR